MSESYFSILVEDVQDNGVVETISTIPIDVCKSRTPTYSAEVTDYPVEAGSSISDNRRIQPDTYEIEGLVSGTPIVAVEVGQSPPQQLKGDSGRGSSSSGDAPVEMQSAHDALLDLHEKGTLVTLIDQFRQYEDMVLEQLTFPRTKDTGVALEFSAKFKKLKVVATAAVALPQAVLKKLKQRQKTNVNKDANKDKTAKQIAQQLNYGPSSCEATSPSLTSTAGGKAGSVPRV